ncbi:MAG: type IV pilin N-terminal domain-containing protein [Methanoregula sp.]
MAFHKKDEHAVSEVVSIILLVAVTIILAAVIAAFVFSMAGNLERGNIAAATISRVNGSYVSVTFAGGQGTGSVAMINWTVNGAAPATYINGAIATPGMQDHPSDNGFLNIGSVALLAAHGPGTDHVVGAAVYSDGSIQIILDKTI